MFEWRGRVTVADLEGLLPMLADLGSAAGSAGVTDTVRVDVLSVLERVKAAAAGAQVRVTAAFVDSQEQVAAQWTTRAVQCSDAGDFQGWRTARDQARLATVDMHGDVGLGPGAGGDGDTYSSGSGRRVGRALRPGAGSGLGVAAQVGLARAVSPSRGARHVREAVVLVRDMPAMLAALEVGAVSEWRAGLVVAETAVLCPGDRRLVDDELAATLGVDGTHPADGGLARLGDRELVRQVKAVAYRVDAASVLARSVRAVTQRRVTIRPAPDTMTYLTALLPVAQGVAVYAALTVAAATARATGDGDGDGDGRSKGQLMADTLVCRVTGQASAAAVPVEVQLVITDRTLLAGTGPGSDIPAQVPGYGTVPAGWARNLLTNNVTSDVRGNVTGEAGHAGDAGDAGDPVAGAARVWLRRLYTHPVDGTLVAMDSTRRTFNGGLRRYLIGRDVTCRTPWCDAPIRHLDHVTDHAAGGPTTAANAQGLCIACNHTKQLPGWQARTIQTWNPHDGAATGGDAGHELDPGDELELNHDLEPDDLEPSGRHTVELTTPTGHRYRSTAPPVIPGHPRARLHYASPETSPLETYLERLLAAA
ncbi:DUF222 domain-containing protein [Lapillicoccus sp.]|uniref:HNH endonuclease n=1 Tax=Lapillicoccus sp. TaxID=1909287 RepID=UPI0032637D59